MERQMEKKYSKLRKRIDDIESQIHPILSETPTTETPPPYNFAAEEINNELHFVNKLIHAELVSNPNRNSDRHHTHHLAHMANRVLKLQSVIHKWKFQPTSSFMESIEQPLCPPTAPCLDEDLDNEELDYFTHEDGRKFSPVGFTVFENLIYAGYDDQDQDAIVEPEEDEETESAEESIVDDIHQVKEIAGNKKEEKIISGYDQKREQEEEKGSYDDDVKTHCGFRVVFWVLVIGMGICCMKAGFSGFPDYHSPVVFLTPT